MNSLSLCGGTGHRGQSGQTRFSERINPPTFEAIITRNAELETGSRSRIVSRFQPLLQRLRTLPRRAAGQEARHSQIPVKVRPVDVRAATEDLNMVALLGGTVPEDLYPPGPKDWSRYSLEVEAKTKQFHDRLLEGMFGKPSKGGSFLLGRLPEGPETLERALSWRFPWGAVCSGHDSKGGGTYITVSYGNRHEEASKAYRRRSVK